MPQSLSIFWNSPLQYWLPRSLWKINPAAGRRRQQAMIKASVTKLARMCSCRLQPTI